MPHRILAALRGSPYLWSLVALVALLSFNGLFTDGFFRIEVRDGHLYGSLIDVLDRAAPLFLVALGMTLVLATGGVDLSVGAVMAIAGAVAAKIVARPAAVAEAGGLAGLDAHGGFAFALLVALAVGCLAGFVNGILVGVVEVQPIVATLILMVAGRGIAQLITDGQIITFHDPAFEFLSNGFFLGLPFTVTLVALLFLCVWLLTRKTAFGLFVEAGGDNPVATRHAGVNIRAIKVLVYTLTGFLSALAGVLVASDIKAADANNAGLYLELDAILAAVLGGTALAGGRFFLGGTLIGAALIQVMTTTILTRGVAVEYTLVVKAIIIVVVCLLQSERVRSFARTRRKVAA